jgi:hypothetical protein
MLADRSGISIANSETGQRERPRVWTERTEQPHRETVNDNGRMGKVDYSDFAVLKKFNLY